MLLVLVLIVLIVMHVLALRLLREHRDLGSQPVLMLLVERVVSGGLLDSHGERVRRDVGHHVLSVGDVCCGAGGVLSDLVGLVIDHHEAYLHDELHEVLKQLSVHPGHEVDLNCNAHHRQDLRDGEDRHEAKVGVVVERLKALKESWHREHVSGILMLAMVDEHLEGAADGGEERNVEVGEVAHERRVVRVETVAILVHVVVFLHLMVVVVTRVGAGAGWVLRYKVT